MSGDYVFSVEVSKSNMTSSASMMIEIIPGSPPTISPLALQSKYKPDQGFTVNAVISGAEGTCVQWESAEEEGFVYLDLALVSKSSKVLCFVRDVPNREYPLVIPDPSSSWPGLKAGARYKFIVSASHPSLGRSEANVIIETLSPPAAGKVVFTPESGEGVKTLFTIEAVDFHDDDTPLTYKFGYRNSQSEKIVWFKKVSSSLPSIETLLPASGDQGLVLWVEVCDADETCVTVQSDSSVRVSAGDLSEDDVLMLGEEAARRAGDQECSEAMSLLTQVE